MSKLPFMPFYPEDWMNGTLGLKPEAKAFYIDMLCLLWKRRGRLANDPAAITELLPTWGKRKTERLLSALIKAGKLIVHGDAVGNSRIDEELAKAEARSEKNRKKPAEKSAPKIQVSSKLDANFDQTSSKFASSFDQIQESNREKSMSCETTEPYTRAGSYSLQSTKKELVALSEPRPARVESVEPPAAASGLEGLNGKTVAIVEALARWLNPLQPDHQTAKGVLKGFVESYGSDAVSRAYADLTADIAGGKLITNALQAFKGYLRKASDDMRRAADARKTAGEPSEADQVANRRKLYDVLCGPYAAGKPWVSQRFPKPGTPGSEVYADILAKHGLEARQ